MKSDFTKKLLHWNLTDNKRLMPWKGEKDPYKIWLSEIILQQTKVEQGLKYYNQFIKEFPTVTHLAKAPRQKIYKLWEGLGYYTRCKNLIETATVISNHYHGKFPSSYDEIKSLKGVGSYTAAAIASFAYNLPYGVVDGNVIRILSRYFGITSPANTSQGKKIYAELAQSLLPKENAAIYNQAIMDFGAVICKPRNPLCNQCVQKKECQAFQNDWVNILPVKEKKIIKKQRWFYYFIIENKNAVYIKQRKEKDIWQNLFEFFLLEKEHPIDKNELLNAKEIQQFLKNTKKTITEISPNFKQQLTHQTIHAQFFLIKVKTASSLLKKNYLLVPKKQLNKYAFPKIIASYLQKNV